MRLAPRTRRCRPAGPALILTLAALLIPRSSVAQSPGETAPVTVSAEEEKPSLSPLGRATDAVRATLSKAALGAQVTGFFDATAGTRGYQPDLLSANDMEIDFAREVGGYFQVGAAVVFNPGDPVALTVGFVDFHLFGGLIAPRGRVPAEKGFHIQAGRFDVPFGNDWIYFASKDRLTVSAPLTTELVMDGGYNDAGIRVLANSRFWNYSAFVLRGHGAGAAYGGRLGLTALKVPYSFDPAPPVFEIGGSFIYDTDGFGRPEDRALAVDFDLQAGPLRFLSEVTRRDVRDPEDYESREVLRGQHLTISAPVKMWPGRGTLAYARVENFRRTPLGGPGISLDNGGAGEVRRNSLNRLTAGFQVALSEFFVLKLDATTCLKTEDASLEAEEHGRRSIVGQLVFRF
jgi:hypothetical protein